MLRFYIVLMGVLGALEVCAQTIRISGSVTDQIGEPINGAIVRSLKSSQLFSISEPNGFFTFEVNQSQSDHHFIFSQIGFTPDTIKYHCLYDTTMRIVLNGMSIREVIVSGSTEQPHIRPGLSTLPLKIIQKLPALGGEIDILKSLSLTPGVTNGSEGSAGLYVRGGSPDQNLILLDDAVVYNPNHLFGFLSAFNASAVSKVDLYKGGFPARFGGRLASVLDIRMKEGNQQKIKKDLQIGLISSVFNVNGPLKKQKATFLLSSRLAYLDLVFLPQRIAYWSGSGKDLFGYRMFDFNAKYNRQISQHRTISLSAYTSQDQLLVGFRTQAYQSKSQLAWGNLTFSAKYQEQLSARATQKIVLTLTHFRSVTAVESESKTESLQTQGSYSNGSRLGNLSLKYHLNFYQSNQCTWRFGTESIVHRFSPKLVQTEIDKVKITDVRQNENAIENAIYTEFEYRPISYLNLHLGLRANHFFIQKRVYPALEPRMNASLSLGKAWYLLTAFHSGKQNLHLLSVGNTGLQNDIWVPSTTKVKPQSIFQYSFGISKKIVDADLNFTLEYYQKRMKGLVDFKEGTSLFGGVDINERWDEQLDPNGIGTSEGFEIGVTKETGRLNGLFAYTFSKTKRQFAEINNGKPYLFNYDFPHHLQTALTYKLSSHWDCSVLLAYRSGQPISLPEVAIVYPPGGINSSASLGIFTERNAYRLPDYFRIDLGFNYSKTANSGREKVWAFSIYNLTNRKNILYAAVENVPQFNSQTFKYDFKKTLKLRTFLPIMPSVAYRISF